MRVFQSLCSGFVLGLFVVSGQAQGAIVFDNFNGTGATNYVEQLRSANQTFGTVLNSTANTTISGMEFRWRPNHDMNVTFLIFDSELGGTFGSVNWAPIGNNLLFSQTKFFSRVVGPSDIAAIPEPTSWLSFGGLVLCLGLADWWQRRRAQRAEP